MLRGQVIEKTGRSVEEAIQAALEELGIPREKAEVEVLEESRQGLFGLGARQARVRVTKLLTQEELVQETARELIQKIDPSLGLECSPREGSFYLNLVGQNLGRVIGKHGDTINSLQFLLQAALAKKGLKVRIILDANGFRGRREETLRKTAQRIAEKVRRLQRPYTFPPMPPMERRLIHLSLQNRPDVKTHSEGEEPYRRVIIEPTETKPNNGKGSASIPSPLAPNRKWLPPLSKRTTLPSRNTYRYLKKGR
ncbi:MAG: protein jag [Caldiserica bacterium]|jgi:spoIIIJ-associated protein|nr:protein jag [Caldisericota bacterium]MDH7562117.1 RNA-binding cell elongation regulator Jag/EloR [Caldisericota bacterium]